MLRKSNPRKLCAAKIWTYTIKGTRMLLWYQIRYALFGTFIAEVFSKKFVTENVFDSHENILDIFALTFD